MYHVNYSAHNRTGSNNTRFSKAEEAQAALRDYREHDTDWAVEMNGMEVQLRLTLGRTPEEAAQASPILRGMAPPDNAPSHMPKVDSQAVRSAAATTSSWRPSTAAAR